MAITVGSNATVPTAPIKAPIGERAEILAQPLQLHLGNYQPWNSAWVQPTNNGAGFQPVYFFSQDLSTAGAHRLALGPGKAGQAVDFGPEAHALETSQEQASHGVRHPASPGWEFDLIFSLCFAAVLATFSTARFATKCSPRALRKVIGRHAKEFAAVPADRLDASLLEANERMFSASRAWWGAYFYNVGFCLFIVGAPDILKMLPYDGLARFALQVSIAAVFGAVAGYSSLRVRRYLLLPELRRLIGRRFDASGSPENLAVLHPGSPVRVYYVPSEPSLSILHDPQGELLHTIFGNLVFGIFLSVAPFLLMAGRSLIEAHLPSR